MFQKVTEYLKVDCWQQYTSWIWWKLLLCEGQVNKEDFF